MNILIKLFLATSIVSLWVLLLGYVEQKLYMLRKRKESHARKLRRSVRARLEQGELRVVDSDGNPRYMCSNIFDAIDYRDNSKDGLTIDICFPDGRVYYCSPVCDKDPELKGGNQ